MSRQTITWLTRAYKSKVTHHHNLHNFFAHEYKMMAFLFGSFTLHWLFQRNLLCNRNENQANVSITKQSSTALTFNMQSNEIQKIYAWGKVKVIYTKSFLLFSRVNGHCI